MPPKRDQGEHAESKIVTELAKEFNIDEVYSGESSFIGSLKTVSDFNPVEIPSNGSLNFDETMIEVGWLIDSLVIPFSSWCGLISWLFITGWV